MGSNVNQEPCRNVPSCISPYDFLKEQGYKLGNIIGEGSYSKVRAAERNGQKYAIKMISRKNATKEYIEKFLPRELAVLRDLCHPNIATIHRIIDFGDRVFILMERAEKGDLLEYIKARRYVPECQAKHFFYQLAQAIFYLHSRQISHRDLKCENILITDNNVIKLTDFGFSRTCVGPSNMQRILSNTYCGSIAYVAPEVILGVPYNPEMYDMWSLGCILFIMVTGTMPFNESNIRKMVRYQYEKRYTFPSSVDLHISTECKLLISRLMEPDVLKRASIDEVVRHRWLRQTG